MFSLRYKVWVACYVLHGALSTNMVYLIRNLHSFFTNMLYVSLIILEYKSFNTWLQTRDA